MEASNPLPQITMPPAGTGVLRYVTSFSTIRACLIRGRRAASSVVRSDASAMPAGKPRTCGSKRRRTNVGLCAKPRSAANAASLGRTPSNPASTDRWPSTNFVSTPGSSISRRYRAESRLRSNQPSAARIVGHCSARPNAVRGCATTQSHTCGTWLDAAKTSSKRCTCGALPKR